VLLLLVFFMLLNAAGIQLDKLTVLTGALGVGLGFGMQNIVNNFVSGLILQYERPIRVGDVLEVGDLNGEMRRIGSRASTMRTFQGAEVIIPNSTFVSGQVSTGTARVSAASGNSCRGRLRYRS
jgi:small-conductance mechanosensitive channel